MIHIESEMLPYLTYQRPTYKGLSSASAGERMTEELDRFIKVNSEWTALLPSHPVNVLDIGAGLGFGTLAMSRLIHNDSTFSILDKSRIEKEIYYGFEQEGAAYNKLSLSRQFLVSNGIHGDRLSAHDVEQDGFPSGEFGIVLSCISWGFHYPVSTYIDKVTSQLLPGGLLYIDLRAGTDGEETIQSAGFSQVWKREGRKTVSTAWKRK